MQYGEAFTKLGYALTAPRQDWSAERDDGVCITLWRTEIDWKTLTMDSRVRGGPLGDWSGLPGNAKRIRHAKRALDAFGGTVRWEERRVGKEGVSTGRTRGSAE